MCLDAVFVSYCAMMHAGLCVCYCVHVLVKCACVFSVWRVVRCCMVCCRVCFCCYVLVCFFRMCVNALFAMYCVMLCGVCVVVFVCSFNVLMHFVFDLLCDVLWLAQ